jgi:hypothetical protein
MADAVVPLKQRRGFAETLRKDAWWVQPLLVLLVFGGFLAYAHIRLFENGHYHYSGEGRNGRANYLSPFYSPLMFDSPGTVSGHAWLHERPNLPSWVSAAMFILIFPAGFRFTCYYYRGAYYKAFWGDPPACAVGEPRKTYWGERTFPLILQNIHRYFLYAALIFIVFLSYDAIVAMFFKQPDGSVKFGLGLGTILMIVNVVLICLYTFGCHSLRHLVGGYRDEVSKNALQKKTYDCVSCLNARHMTWAWLSLFSVAFTDVYIRMCSIGAWTDLRLF